MHITDKQLEFFKKYIQNKLDGIKNDIGDMRYKLYMAIVDECTDYNELREMAELELQIDMITYTNNVLAKQLKKINADFDTVREINKHPEIITATKEQQEDNMGLLEDIEDDEVMQAMAMMLHQRLATEPLEEINRQEYLDSINEEEPNVDDIDIDEIEGDFGDITDMSGDLEKDLIDEDDIFDIDDSDFGDLDDDLEDNDLDDFDDVDGDIDEDDDTLYNKENSLHSTNEVENTLDNDGEEDDFDIDDDDFGDLGDDDDMFDDIDDEDFGDIGDLGELETNLYSGVETFDFDDGFEEFDLGDMEYTDDDTMGFDEFDLDDISEDDLCELGDEIDDFDDIDEDDFGDLGDDEEDDLNDEIDIDDIEVDEDDFGDLGDDEGESDLTDDDIFDVDINDFGDLGDDEDELTVKTTKVIDDSKEITRGHRQITKENVFNNGTERGKKTQDTFNTLIKLGGLTANASKKAGKNIEKMANSSIKNMEKSGMFKLPEDDDEYIDF